MDDDGAPIQTQPVDPRDSRHQTLSRIHAAHCLLDLRFEHHPGAYHTVLLELVPGAGYMVLDALTPADGNEQAMIRRGIWVRTRLQGLEVKFASRIVQRGSHNGLPYFKALYPAVIDLPQRRREFRVTVPMSKGVAVRFHTRDGGSVRGEIRDLSPGGFCARLLAGDTAAVERDIGRTITCEIDLPNHSMLSAAIAICHVFPSRGRSAPRVGARFVEIDARDERQLERCVADLARGRVRVR